MRKLYIVFDRHPGYWLLPGGLAFTLLCISLFSFSQGDSWQQKQSMGTATTSRYQAVSFSINGKGYVGTGFDFSVKKDFWEYDPATNVWTQKANFAGGARSSATGFSIGNKGYIGLGGSYSDFWEYDPANNVWARKADFGGGVRSGAAGFSIGSKGYVGTGVGLNGNKNDFWEYDPLTDVWTQKANFAGSVRNKASGLSIGNKGYIGLGRSSIFDFFSDFWEYDPVADTWVQKAAFGGGARWGASGFSIGNKGYLGTGNHFLSTNDLWEYDPATNVWVQKVNLQGPQREEAIGFSTGIKGYIGIGYQSTNQYAFGPLNDFYEFDPAMNTWAQKADFGVGPRMFTVGFGIANKGYVGTGFDGASKKDFWEFDPVTGLWTQKADFAGGLRQQATGFSLGNKGFLGQGYVRGRADFTNDFWQYDPPSNTWTKSAAPPSILARARAVTFNIGGKQYFGMGYYYASNLYDFWEFDPATGWTQKASLPVSAWSLEGFGAGNKGYVLGNGFWEYDPVVNTWTQKIYPGIGGDAFSIKGKGYVLAGNNALYEYNAATDSWVPRASFPGPARGGGTAFSIGNKGYFGFGSGSEGFLNDFWEYTPPLDNTVTTTVTPDTLCSGTMMAVSFVAKGTFDTGNVFTAQLSDPSGGFSQPEVIGTDTTTTSGIMNIIVPDSIAAGQAYRIRVVSDKPAVTGSDNGINLVINPPPVASAKNYTVYLNEKGKARVRPENVDSGSAAYCGTLKLMLDDPDFNCANIGFNKVALTVIDGNGTKATDTAVITVLDSSKPQIRYAFAFPDNLWPPNHKMRKVTVFYRATDNCSIAEKSLSVTSNDTPGGNNPDWIILDDHHVLLRASINKRYNKERIYYITITAKDSSGNTAADVVKVVVSPDKKDDHWWPGKENNLFVTALPNPSRQYFTLMFRSNNDQPIHIRVTDILGRVIEERRNIAPNSTVQIGSDYRPGSYYIQVVQGKKRVTIHLVKQSK